MTQSFKFSDTTTKGKVFVKPQDRPKWRTYYRPRHDPPQDDDGQPIRLPADEWSLNNYLTKRSGTMVTSFTMEQPEWAKPAVDEATVAELTPEHRLAGLEMQVTALRAALENRPVEEVRAEPSTVAAPASTSGVGADTNPMPKGLMCAICGFEAKSKAGLATHMKRKHAEPKE